MGTAQALLREACHEDPANSEVWRPEEECEAQIWLGVGRKGFVFPELRRDGTGVPAVLQKDDFAICVSGGGMRATTCALGWVRALYALGILQRARYLCSNSGGSWFNICFSYQEVADNEVFLGPYIQPEDLTWKLAGAQKKGSYAKVVSDADYITAQLVRKMVGSAASLDCCRVNDLMRFRAWSDTVGDAFFAAHGLDHANCAFGLHGRTQRIEDAGAREVHTACRESTMPFPIQVATVMLPDHEQIYHSYEFTPMYAGVPTAVKSMKPSLGGVLVEAFAACSDPPERAELEDDDDCPLVSLDVRWVVPLPQVAGISSQFIAQRYADVNFPGLWELMGCSEVAYWNGRDLKSEEVLLADGGGTDNLAIFPALRRGVQKLLVCVAAGTAPDDNWAETNWDLAGYFGACPEGKIHTIGAAEVDAATWNRTEQVFEQQKWEEMLDRLMDLQEVGRPLVVRLQSEVLRNDEQGIAGGYSVDMLWIFNGGEAGWLRRLPEETGEALEEGTPAFPYLGVFTLDYEPELVGCLSNLAAWNIYQAEAQINSLLSN